MTRRYTIYYTEGGKDVLFGHGYPSHDMNETVLNIHTSETDHVLIPWSVIKSVSIMEVKA